MAASWLKRISAALALCLTLGTTGCLGGKESSDAETGETQTSQTDEVQEEKVTSKVGFVFNSTADSGYTAQLNAQRIKAAEHSNIETCYVEDVSVTDLEGAVKALAAEGCDYIVTASPVYENALTNVASRYMNINFICMGRSVNSFNIYACTAQPYQAAYAAGMAAAYNSESEKIGVIADPDMLYAIPVVNAAALGTQIVYKDAELCTAFATKDDEVESAVKALSNEGCDVIICYTETERAQDCCEESGIKYISSLNCAADANERDNLLMYFTTNYESFFLAQYKQISLKTWISDAYVGTAANGCINISAVCSAAKNGTQDILSALLPKISSGSAYVFEGQLKDTSGTVRYMKNTAMTESEIYSMSWYVEGVSILDNFRKPITDIPANNFVVKY